MASPHTTIFIQEPSLQGHGLPNLHADTYQLYQPSHLTVDQFRPNTVEKNCLALLQEDVFKSMLLKPQPLVDNSSLPEFLPS